MLWVLKRTVSMRRFFEHPKNRHENYYNFTLAHKMSLSGSMNNTSLKVQSNRDEVRKSKSRKLDFFRSIELLSYREAVKTVFCMHQGDVSFTHTKHMFFYK